MTEDATSRAINAEPWQPLPGMVKAQCAACAYWFATATAAKDPAVERCPDCARQRMPARRKAEL